MTRKLRYLRIAFSVTCGIACLLLVVLWIRSYWFVEGLNWQLTENRAIGIGSLPGCMGIAIYPQQRRTSLPRWSLETEQTEQWIASARRQGELVPSRIWGQFYAGPLYTDHVIAVLPNWCAILLMALCGSIAAAPWLRWRFSLRTLLIGTTLIAVALGVIAYAAR